MPRITFAASLAVVLVCLPSGIAAQAAPATSQSARANADLETMTSFFFPSRPVNAFIVDYFSTRYRAQLMEDAGLVELDRAMPGLIDHMIAAAQAHCERETTAFVHTIRVRIGEEWSGLVTPAENARLAQVFKPDVDIAEALNVEVRPGDTAADIDSRFPTLPAADRRAFEARQAALAASPGGASLIQRVADYQADLASRQDAMMAGLADMVRAAVRASRLAANEFVAARGHDPIYAE